MAISLVFVNEDGSETEYAHSFISYPEAFMFLKQNKYKEISREYSKSTFEKETPNSPLKKIAYVKKKVAN